MNGASRKKGSQAPLDRWGRSRLGPARSLDEATREEGALKKELQKGPDPSTPRSNGCPRSTAGAERYETPLCSANPRPFARLPTTATSSFGSAGFDKYIWNPAPRMVTRSSILA